MRRLISTYKALFQKSFFFDKFGYHNIFQLPKIRAVQLTAHTHLENKLAVSKLILLFYILTGQKPRILLKDVVVRSTRRKRITGLSITVQQYEQFLD